jgi:2-polyprenyl-6-methoxyphenol hydroxylase-like FAD-dependent oxidoreductase
LIIGGSLGGLFAGNLLRQINWDVDIFERSAHDLDSRGGGIVLQPEVIEVFRRVGVDIQTINLGVRSKYRTVFWPDGSIQSKHFAPQTQTSWSLVYTTLKAVFGDGNYHQSKTLVRVDRDAESLLPLPFREVVEATTQPFAQAIRDLASDHIVAGRAVIVGDAAAIPRTHTAASTSKAATNALGLADELQASPKDVPAALAHWEPPQVALGKYLRQQGSQTGDYLLFHRPPVAKIG